MNGMVPALRNTLTLWGTCRIIRDVCTGCRRCSGVFSQATCEQTEPVNGSSAGVMVLIARQSVLESRDGGLHGRPARGLRSQTGFPSRVLSQCRTLYNSIRTAEHFESQSQAKELTVEDFPTECRGATHWTPDRKVVGPDPTE
jgi:hypothetical protein